MRTKLTVLVLAAAATLAACGGGDDTPPPTSQVPASANASIDGLVAYLKALVVAPADTLEPVDVSAVTPPTDETGDPQVVD